jgi:hypothetical protein
MAPFSNARPHALRLSAVALAALSLTPIGTAATAQTVYREYDDGRVEFWSEDDPSAPLRRPPPRSFDDEEDERFERDDDLDEDDFDDDLVEDRQGTLDLSPRGPREPDSGEPVDREPVTRKAPVPPPSVDARPTEKAWKPAL